MVKIPTLWLTTLPTSTTGAGTRSIRLSTDTAATAWAGAIHARV